MARGSCSNRHLATSLIYIIKEFVQPEMSLNREFLIWKERWRGVRESERCGWVSRQAYLRFKRDTERQRDIETKRQS
jgi:hypothetical protein